MAESDNNSVSYDELNQACINKYGFGVLPDGSYYRPDLNAGLSDDEIKRIDAIKSTGGQEQARIQMLKSHGYDDTYLKVESSDPAEQSRLDEITLVARSLDPAYLNSLNGSEFQNFAKEYVAYCTTHETTLENGVYGVTDEQWNAFSDEEKAAATQTSNETCTKWFNKHGEALMNLYETGEPSYTDPNVQEEPSVTEKEDAPETTTSENKVSCWAALKENVGNVMTSVRTWIESKAVGAWVLDKFDKAKDFVEDKIVDPIKDKFSQRAAQADAIVNHDSASAEAEVQI